MIAITDFWESNYYNHSDLTDEMINAAETTLKVKLPDSLIALLKIINGDYTMRFAFPMNVSTSWAENHIPLDTLNGIVPAETLSSPPVLFDSQYMTDEWGFPEKQVLLSGDGHYFITLDYRESDVPRVRWIDTECDEGIHIADSFKDFLNGLVSDDHYAEE